MIDLTIDNVSVEVLIVVELLHRSYRAVVDVEQLLEHMLQRLVWAARVVGEEIVQVDKVKFLSLMLVLYQISSLSINIRTMFDTYLFHSNFSHFCHLQFSNSHPIPFVQNAINFI